MRARLAKLLRCLATPRYLRVLVKHGVAAASEHEPLLAPLRCRTILDIGANRGQFALAARHCFPEARIISFEPLAAPAEVFAAVFRSDKSVTLHQAAIGPERGRALIHISGRDDSSSLLRITARQNSLFPGTAEVGIAEIVVAPLQDFLDAGKIEAPALLKLDVQGFELQALRGCEPVMDRFDYIYAECSFLELYEGQALADEVIDWLRERGFRLAGVHNVAYRDGQAVQADMLFKSKACT